MCSYDLLSILSVRAVRPYFCSSVRPFIHPFVRPSIYLFVRLSVRCFRLSNSVPLSVRSFIGRRRPSVRSSVRPSDCPFVRSSVLSSDRLSTVSLSVHPFIPSFSGHTQPANILNKINIPILLISPKSHQQRNYFNTHRVYTSPATGP